MIPDAQLLEQCPDELQEVPSHAEGMGGYAETFSVQILETALKDCRQVLGKWKVLLCMHSCHASLSGNLTDVDDVCCQHGRVKDEVSWLCYQYMHSQSSEGLPPCNRHGELLETPHYTSPTALLHTLEEQGLTLEEVTQHIQEYQHWVQVAASRFPPAKVPAEWPPP